MPTSDPLPPSREIKSLRERRPRPTTNIQWESSRILLDGMRTQIEVARWRQSQARARVKAASYVIYR